LFSCWNKKNNNNNRNIISGWENQTGVYRVGILLIGIPTLLGCVWVACRTSFFFFGGLGSLLGPVRFVLGLGENGQKRGEGIKSNEMIEIDDDERRL
jgi:hypothetical protein